MIFDFAGKMDIKPESRQSNEKAGKLKKIFDLKTLHAGWGGGCSMSIKFM